MTKYTQIAVELDSIQDIDAHRKAMAELFYGDAYMKDEYAAIDTVVPGFYSTTKLLPIVGALGALRRLRELEPRLHVHLITDRPDRFRMENQAWVDAWFAGWEMPSTTVSHTSDFTLVPAQIYVVAERHEEQLEKFRCVRTVAELVGAQQDKLDFETLGNV